MVQVVILFTGLLTFVDPSHLKPAQKGTPTVLLLPGAGLDPHEATLRLLSIYVDRNKQRPIFCNPEGSWTVCRFSRKEISLLPAMPSALTPCATSGPTVKSLTIPSGYSFDGNLLGPRPALPIGRMPLLDGMVCGDCRIVNGVTGNEFVFQEVDANGGQSAFSGALASAIQYTAAPREPGSLTIRFTDMDDDVKTNDLALDSTPGPPRVVVSMLPSNCSPGDCLTKPPDSSVVSTCPRSYAGRAQLPHYASFFNVLVNSSGSIPLCSERQLLYYDPQSLTMAIPKHKGKHKGKLVPTTFHSLGDPLCPPTQLP